MHLKINVKDPMVLKRNSLIEKQGDYEILERNDCTLFVLERKL